MLKRLSVTVAAVLLASCYGFATVKSFKFPQEGQIYTLRCRTLKESSCRDKALKLCPQGYETLSSSRTGSIEAPAAPEEAASLTTEFKIRCKQ
ncbi:MAG: hypothetical protein D6719_13510 [Candidatus Dadabacteria bacterium]|nr:MAG: hypothetical protein D6719_13510 [Candidatus Dadabacteria bacterium]